ncbi:hypothetical protein SAMN05216436_10651 [bacterium A37T11]|nr:hypothetical protein SAMN05216436_10651 [bacterium A37T11]
MIRKACKSLDVDYLLMDSWFTCEKMLIAAKKLNIKLIGMMKMAKANYDYQGLSYTAKELLSKLNSQKKRCRKLNAFYIEVQVQYKGHEVKLFFFRFGNQEKWQLILSTDLKTAYLKTMELYQVRWSIEVFFKESKQYLNMGKSQAEDLAAQFADITITMVQYILLTLRKRFGDYETKGEIFREAEEKIMKMTLDHRLWGLFLELVCLVVKIFGLTIENIDAFMQRIIENKKLKRLVSEYAQEAA